MLFLVWLGAEGAHSLPKLVEIIFKSPITRQNKGSKSIGSPEPIKKIKDNLSIIRND
jgi:hypothetical protein